MPDTFNYDPTLDSLSPQFDSGEEDKGSVSWGDRGRAFVAGAAEGGAQLGSGVRALGDKTGDDNISNFGDFVSKLLTYGGKSAEEGMSEEARDEMHAAVTSPDFWEHPFSASILHAANMTPSMAIAMAPALLTEGLAAPLSVAAVAGAQGASASAADVYSLTDKKSDEELQDQFPFYTGLRSTGVSEEKARKELNTKLMGIKPVINAAMNAAGMLMGPAGRVAGIIPEAAGTGLLKRAGIGAAEGFVGGAGMGGTAEATHEQTLVDMGQSNGLDPATILAAAVNSGAEVGALGALGGAAFPHGGPEKVDIKGPTAEQLAALNAKNPPAPPARKEGTLSVPGGAGETAGGGPGAGTGTVTPPGNVPGVEAGAAVTPSVADQANALLRGKPTGPTSEIPTGADTVAPSVADQANALLRNKPTGPTSDVLPPTPLTPEGEALNAEFPIVGTKRADEVAQPGGALDQARADLVKNDESSLPETQKTLEEQRRQLITGNRKAIFYPDTPAVLGKSATKNTPFVKGQRAKSTAPEAPPGIEAVKAGGGWWHYNPNEVSRGDVLKAVGDSAAAQAARAKLLEMGPSRAEIAAEVKKGQPLVAAVERTGDGTEVKTAATTPNRAAETLSAFEGSKGEGNTVGLENGAKVEADRLAAAQTVGFTPDGKRVLRTVNAPEAAEAKVEAAPEETPQQKLDRLRTARLARDAQQPKSGEAVQAKAAEAKVEKAEAVKPAPVSGEGVKAKAAADRVETAAAKAGSIFDRVTGTDRAPTVKDEAGKTRLSTKQEFQDLARANEKARIAEEAKKRDVGPKGPQQATGKGRRRGPKEKAARSENNDKAQEIVDATKATAAEVKNRETAAGKPMLMARVKRMVEMAREAKLKFPGTVKDNIDASHNHSNATILLNEARKLEALGSKASPDAIRKFMSREFELLHNGEEGRTRVLEEVKAENDAKYGKRPTAEAAETAADEGEGSSTGTKVENVADDTQSVDTEADDDTLEPEIKQVVQAPETPKVTLTGNEGQGYNRTLKGVEVVKQKVRGRKPTSAAVDLADTPEGAASMLRLEKAVEGKSIHEVAQHIADHSASGSYRFIARQVVKALRRMENNGVKFNFHVAHVGDTIPRALLNARGISTFDPKSMSREAHVWVNGADVTGKQGVTEQTILHELVHTVTQQALHVGRWGKGDFQAKQFRKDLLRLSNAVVEAFNKKAEAYRNGDLSALNEFEKNIFDRRNNALADEHEVLAWGQTNPQMQDFMESIPYKNGSLFSDFVHTIRKLLGLPAKSETALTELMRISEDLYNVDDVDVGRRINEHWGGLAGKSGEVQSQAHNDAVNDAFHENLNDALTRGGKDAKNFVAGFTQKGKVADNAVRAARSTSEAGKWLLNKFTTFGQIVGAHEHDMPHIRGIFEANERTGVLSRELQEKGSDLAGMLIRAQKQNPGLFDRYTKLRQNETMVGADASQPLGEGRNRHLGTSKKMKARLAKGERMEDMEHEVASNAWEGRAAHPELKKEYDAIVAQDPRYAMLHDEHAKFYAEAQPALQEDMVNQIMDTFEYRGTDAERAAVIERVMNGTLNKDEQADLATKLGQGEGGGKEAVKAILATGALRRINGPFEPQMRRGEHAVVGTYKVKEPANGTKINDNTWEFKTRKEAYDFAKKNDLHYKVKNAYYDPATGKQVRTKIEAESTAGSAETRFQVELQRQHLRFHENLNDARAELTELGKSGDMENVALEARQNLMGANSDLDTRGIKALLKSLEQQDRYKNASEAERKVLRTAIEEAGFRNLTGNRVQSRRIARRRVEGGSTDSIRNLIDYNTSQANYRARMATRKTINEGIEAMRADNKARRYDGNVDAALRRSQVANEVEKRALDPDLNEDTGGWSRASRRISTWSYIDRMLRASHLILHQAHLPMISSPYMAGRHGFASAYGETMRAWRELTNFYKAGGADAWASTVGSAVQKGTHYGDLAEKLLAGAPDAKRLKALHDELTRIGYNHPSTGIEVQKYQPSNQLGGPVGALDAGLQKADTIFRALTNSTEAINRMAGANAAYRLEFRKLTREGKAEADAHQGAIDYAKKVIHETQGVYSATNAAPIFKNKYLKPFLQFKQFPQMMYHLLGSLTKTALSRDTPKIERMQAIKSLGGILATHALMAGVVTGTPQEPLKVLVTAAHALGLADSDWTDVENAERKAIKDTLGDEAGRIFINGLGSELFGVDVRHRLGMGSLLTWGMPSDLDSKSSSEFIMNTVAGAPGSMALDAVKGVSKMLHGDMEEGALQAFPLQALRDARNAIAPPKKKYDYTPTGVDSVKALLGFTPAKKAQALEAQNAVYEATHKYQTERTDFSKKWATASPAERENLWSEIQAWNADKPSASKLTKGDLFKAAHAAMRNSRSYNRVIGGVTTTPHTKGIAQGLVDLYQ